MFQSLLKLLVPLSKYNILKIKVIFWYFKRKYVYSTNDVFNNFYENITSSKFIPKNNPTLIYNVYTNVIDKSHIIVWRLDSSHF